MNDFWKVDAYGWGNVISAYPLRPNTITKVTFEIVVGAIAFIGCGVLPSDLNILRTKEVGLFPDSVSFNPFKGESTIMEIMWIIQHPSFKVTQ